MSKVNNILKKVIIGNLIISAIAILFILIEPTALIQYYRIIGSPVGNYSCTLSENGMGWAQASIQLDSDGLGRYMIGSGEGRWVGWTYDKNTGIVTLGSMTYTFEPPDSLFKYTDNPQRNSTSCKRIIK